MSGLWQQSLLVGTQIHTGLSERRKYFACSKPVFPFPKSNNAPPSEFSATIQAVHLQIFGVS